MVTPIGRPIPIFEQGDVVKVPFPYTDQSTRQRRPALVISRGHLGRDQTLLWVAMITSANNASWPHDVALDDLGRAGLSAPSVVRSCKMATIEAGHCERVGQVDARVVEQVLATIHLFLD